MEHQYFNSYLIKPVNSGDDLNNNLISRYKFSTPFIPRDDASEWEMSIYSLSINMGLVPICVWNDYYYVGIQYNGTLYPVKCDFVPSSNISSSYDFVYQISSIVSSFNTAIATAVSDANSAGASISEVPELVFNEETGLFNIVCNIDDFVTASPKPLICWNRSWQNLTGIGFDIFTDASVTSFTSVSGIENDYQNQLFVGGGWKNRVMSAETGLNNATGAYYSMNQTFSTVGSIYGVHSIRLLSSQSPVKPEQYVSDSTIWLNQSLGVQNIGSEKIISDLVTEVKNWDELRSRVTYFPSLYTWHNVNGQNLNELEIRLVWISNDGVQHDIHIPSGSICSVKLALRRKR